MDVLGSEEADYLPCELHGPGSVSDKVAYICPTTMMLSSPGCEECEQGPFPGLVVHLLPCLGVQGRSPGQQQQAANYYRSIVTKWIQEVVGCLSLVVESIAPPGMRRGRIRIDFSPSSPLAAVWRNACNRLLPFSFNVVAVSGASSATSSITSDLDQPYNAVNRNSGVRLCSSTVERITRA